MRSLSALTILALILSINSAFAGAERECSSQVLNCRLEKILSTGARSLFGQSATKFDGRNDDEPSIPPDFCKISTSLDDDTGVSFVVNITDDNFFADIYAVKNHSMLNSDVAFKVTAGSPFYYRNGSNILTCVLSK